MDALGLMLWFCVVWAWMWPEKFGVWIADVQAGMRKAGE